MNEKQEKFVWKRDVNYASEALMVNISKPLVNMLKKSSITPNMITMFNMVVIFPSIILVCLFDNYILISVLIFLYALFDVIDGNLARNKGLCSNFGKILDNVSDTLFYTVGYFFIGMSIKLNLWAILGLILIQQIYGIVATFYIVPQMKDKKNFKHTKLKQWFRDKGIIFGMDAVLQCIITVILLLCKLRRYIFLLCFILWLCDLVYRLYELIWYNRNET